MSAEPQTSEQRFAVNSVKVDSYKTFLHEPSRPPSRGGDTTALHVHVLTIAGDSYSFFARGSRRWVYARDTVSFEYVVVKDGKYRNVDKATIVTTDAKGKPVVRGDRSWKQTLRTAPMRAPGSRREQRD